jgi:hypothetical protein
MIAGRVLSLCGVEIAIILRVSVVDKWFAGSFASGINGLALTVSGLGVAVAAYYLPLYFIKERSLSYVLFVYTLVNAFGFFVSVIYYFVERKNEIFLEHVNDEEEDLDFMSYEFKFKDIKNLSFNAKLFLPIIAVSCSSYFMFTTFGTDSLMNLYGLSYEDAKNKIALLPLISLFVTPLYAAFITKYGKKGIFLIVCSLMVTGAHLSWQFIPPSRPDLIIYPIVVLGIFKGMYGCMGYALLAQLLPKQAVSTMIGIASAITNISFASFPVGLGYVVKDRTRAAYLRFTWICAGTAALYCVLSFVAMVVDLRTSRLLHLSENSKEAVEKREKMSVEIAKIGRKRGLSYKSMGVRSQETLLPEEGQLSK